MIIKTDAYVTEKFQQGYDYLLDKFGIMKGTFVIILASISTAVSFMSYNKGDTAAIINFISIIPVVYIGIHIRSAQMNKKYTSINRIANHARHSLFVWFGKLMSVFYILFYNFVSNSPYSSYVLIEFWCLIITCYVFAVYVRDREERRETKFSFQGT